jgi:hypothetical protein
MNIETFILAGIVVFVIGAWLILIWIEKNTPKGW